MKQDNKTGAAAVILLFFGAPALVIAAMMWRGYILSIVWRWLIQPTFFGAPDLSIPAAIGVSMVVGFLTQHASTKSDDEWQTGLIKIFLVPLIFLGVAWVVQSFI